MTQDEITLTADNVKALAHPLRVRVLGLLRTYGPATATTLAAQLELTSGALSYHLRQLERFGFIVEDTERGNQRDRWWKAAHQRTIFSGLPDDAPGEATVEGDVYEDSVAAAAIRHITQAMASRHDEPLEWRRSINLSDYLLQLTPTEAESLSTALSQLLDSYRQHDPNVPRAPGTRLVDVQFQILPVQDPRPVEE